MAELFDKFVRVTVGAGATRLRVGDLRIAFKVERSLKPEPNKLELQIYNMNEESRKRAQEQGAEVEIIAGYFESNGLIFRGQVTQVTHARVGPDWVTKIQAADGVGLSRKARVSETFGKGTPVASVLRRLADLTGFDKGNLEAVLSALPRGGVTEFSKGFSAAGGAFESLEKVARSAGLETSIQAGKLTFATPGAPVDDLAVVLNSSTGLIESPEVGEKGVIKARSLLQPRLVPGARVVLETAREGRIGKRRLVGNFRVESVKVTADTHDSPWYSDVEMRAY